MATRQQQKGTVSEISIIEGDNFSMQFADSRIPKMEKVLGKEYVPFGDERNDYPTYLLHLYNKSALHNAIIVGKCMYIIGNGLDVDSMANESQSWGKLIEILNVDIETFGGCYVERIPKLNGNGYNSYHISYDRIRTNETNSEFFYKKDWINPYKWRECERQYPEYYAGIKEPSIFFYKEYRAGKTTYPLPSYVGACNDIESSIETSKHTLTNAKTGFSAGKLITFYGGDDETKKRNIDKRIKNAYSGAEGIKYMLSFVPDASKKPTVEDLGQSDLSKENITPIQTIITQNILSGHGVTHGLLFGIQQEGKLGGATELRTAYNIFNKNYVQRKQKALENIVFVLGGFEAKIIPSEPIEIEFSEATILQVAPKEWITDKLAIDPKYFEVSQSQGARNVISAINSLSPLVANKVLESMSEDEVRSLANLTPKTSELDESGMPIISKTSDSTNNVITKLSGREFQGMMRIVRQFTQEKLNKDQAAILLKQGYGFTDEDVNAYLGIDADPLTQDAKFSSQYNEVDVAMMFGECGEDDNGYSVVKSEDYNGNDEGEFNLQFKAIEALTELEKKISDILKTDSKVTNEAIAKVLNQPISLIDTTINKLINDSFIKAETVGNAIVRKVVDRIPKSTLPNIQIMYSYSKRDGVQGADLLPTSRPFCVRMLTQNKGKLYSRSDIQKISERLGYSVFNRSGGFWNNNGTVDAQCRHGWFRKVVIKK